MAYEAHEGVYFFCAQFFFEGGHSFAAVANASGELLICVTACVAFAQAGHFQFDVIEFDKAAVGVRPMTFSAAFAVDFACVREFVCGRLIRVCRRIIGINVLLCRWWRGVRCFVGSVRCVVAGKRKKRDSRDDEKEFEKFHSINDRAG